jgi:hypothetical protein
MNDCCCLGKVICVTFFRVLITFTLLSRFVAPMSRLTTTWAPALTRYLSRHENYIFILR